MEQYNIQDIKGYLKLKFMIDWTKFLINQCKMIEDHVKTLQGLKQVKKITIQLVVCLNTQISEKNKS